jgi:hypothetical protein
MRYICSVAHRKEVLVTALRRWLGGFIVASCASAAIVPQALHAQAPLATRSYPVTSFDKIAAAGPNRVIVHVGGRPAVTAEGPNETLDRMEIIVERGELQIRPRREPAGFDRERMKPATFTVTVPRLVAASLAGSGDMRVDRTDADRFGASVAGSGHLEIGAMRVNRATFGMAGSGTLTARGSAGEASVSVAGSGTVDARGVSSRTASVTVAGSGNAELSAQGTAHVSVVGSGNAQIFGRAHCTLSRIGSGRARCNA